MGLAVKQYILCGKEKEVLGVLPAEGVSLKGRPPACPV